MKTILKELDEKEIDTILHVTGEIAYQGGKNALVLVLKGSRSKVIREKGLDRVKGYAAFKDCTAQEIKNKIGWMIENGWLNVEYRQKQPLVFQAPKGQEKIKKAETDRVFGEFDTWIRNKKTDVIPMQLKEINRDVKLNVLQKILSRKMYEYIPILHNWKTNESKRMKKKINDTIRALIPDFFERPFTYLRKFSQASPQERVGRKLAFILRHHPELFGLQLDENGFVAVKDLAQALNTTEVEVKKIVDAQDKKRFEIKRGKVRALYGHSLPVKIDLKKTKPPKLLFHSAPRWVKEKIQIEGLRPMKRGYIHLGADIEQAQGMSTRGEDGSVIFKVNANEAHNNGVIFFKVDDVYLAEKVPPQFLETLPDKDEEKLAPTPVKATKVSTRRKKAGPAKEKKPPRKTAKKQ